MRKLLILLFIMINTIFLTGCWDYDEIDKLAIVAGGALDKGTNGNGYKLAIEVVEVSEGMQGSSFNSEIIESEGETIFDAVRNMIKISTKKLYWNHATCIIVSEDVAKEGLLPLLDFIARQKDIRLNTHILISKEKTAEEILLQESILTEIRSFEIQNILKEHERLAKAPNIPAYKIINQVAQDTPYSALPTVSIVLNAGEKTADISGSAILNEDKLSFFLNPKDTMLYLFTQNEIKGGVLIVDVDGNENQAEKVTLEIDESKTKINLNDSMKNLSIDVKINVKVIIGELNTKENFIDEKGRKKLKSLAEKSLKKDIEEFITMIQTKHGDDIFGFGDYIKRNDPKLWKNIKSDWDSIFPQIDINVKPNIEIIGSEHFSKPIKVGD